MLVQKKFWASLPPNWKLYFGLYTLLHSSTDYIEMFGSPFISPKICEDLGAKLWYDIAQPSELRAVASS